MKMLTQEDLSAQARRAVEVAVARLGVSPTVARLVAVDRNVAMCERVKGIRHANYAHDASWENRDRFMAAQDYLTLARKKAPLGVWVCGDCAGSGIYHGHGYVENGRFKGFTGECFRCGGKGYQTKADRNRNDYYDNHVRRVYA